MLSWLRFPNQDLRNAGGLARLASEAMVGGAIAHADQSPDRSSLLHICKAASDQRSMAAVAEESNQAIVLIRLSTFWVTGCSTVHT
jgi:hypothetical protein